MTPDMGARKIRFAGTTGPIDKGLAETGNYAHFLGNVKHCIYINHIVAPSKRSLKFGYRLCRTGMKLSKKFDKELIS
ncbi:MAG: hypothetical protein KDJ77_03530 [Rhodobiaceae bacterium]|nr:hypothetical protein [Rhodobiaceae bacterium]